MGNPFTAFAMRRPDVAAKIAHAVATSRDLDQLWACLRLLDRLAGVDGGWHSGYLAGCHFRQYQNDWSGLVEAPLAFAALSDAAWAFLGED